MAESQLTQSIRKANDAGRKALIPYIPAGFGGKEKFWEYVRELDAAGADVIEIGVPFSDPVADGPTVERVSQECLACGITLHWIIDGLREHRKELNASIVLMGYISPFFHYGFEQLAKDAAEVGVNGFIVPDLPYEEAGEFLEALKGSGISLVPLIGLNTSLERMELYTKDFGGFCYVVSVMGVTGERAAISASITTKLAQARKTFNFPVALGFGISHPEQLEEFASELDAVVFGSALITHLEEGGTPAEFMSRWTTR